MKLTGEAALSSLTPARRFSIPCTTFQPEKHLPVYPHRVVLEPVPGVLERRTPVLVEQLRAIDRRRLRTRRGYLSPHVMDLVEEGMAIALGYL
jgi:mRNA-degrading endonuclease toxin of MazEF toxin-antitoxin module